MASQSIAGVIFKSFVVFFVFGPWHQELVGVWHDNVFSDHQFLVPFLGQDFPFCQLIRYRKGILAIIKKKKVLCHCFLDVYCILIIFFIITIVIFFAKTKNC